MIVISELSTDLDAFLAAIAASPDDDSPKLIFADWLSDQGDDVTERAVRWCVREGKWPYWSTYIREFWWVSESDPDKHRLYAKVPWISGANTLVDFTKLPDALRWLGEQLEQEH